MDASDSGRNSSIHGLYDTDGNCTPAFNLRLLEKGRSISLLTGCFRISRDRFFELHRYLHFADNSSHGLPGTPEYDKLGKIKPINEKVSERFRSVYTTQMNVAIDEAMIPFKGRSTLKQYLSGEGSKCGH